MMSEAINPPAEIVPPNVPDVAVTLPPPPVEPPVIEAPAPQVEEPTTPATPVPPTKPAAIETPKAPEMRATQGKPVVWRGNRLVPSDDFILVNSADDPNVVVLVSTSVSVIVITTASRAAQLVTDPPYAQHGGTPSVATLTRVNSLLENMLNKRAPFAASV